VQALVVASFKEEAKKATLAALSRLGVGCSSFSESWSLVRLASPRSRR